MDAVVGGNRKFSINIYTRYNAIDIGRPSQQLWNSKVVARSWSHIAHATWCSMWLWWMCSIELIRFATTFAVTYQCLSGIIIQFAYRSKVCYVWAPHKYFSSSTHTRSEREKIYIYFAHHHILTLKLRKAAQRNAKQNKNTKNTNFFFGIISFYLSSPDPILTAFELSWELRRLSRMETEFRTEYNVNGLIFLIVHVSYPPIPLSFSTL